MNIQINKSDKNKMKNNKKLSELSDKKIKYVYYMFQLEQVKNPLLKEHVCHLMKLLRYAINIENSHVLEELDECFSSLMLTYIFDINDVINDRLNIEKYTDRHDNLIRINNIVEHQLKNYNPCYLNEFKQTLLKL